MSLYSPNNFGRSSDGFRSSHDSSSSSFNHSRYDIFSDKGKKITLEGEATNKCQHCGNSRSGGIKGLLKSIVTVIAFFAFMLLVQQNVSSRMKRNFLLHSGFSKKEDTKTSTGESSSRAHTFFNDRKR